jgi:hypothetical protein
LNPYSIHNWGTLWRLISSIIEMLEICSPDRIL